MRLTYVFEELFCDDSCSCVEGDLHLTNLLVNVLHKLHTHTKSIELSPTLSLSYTHTHTHTHTHHNMPYLNHKVN